MNHGTATSKEGQNLTEGEMEEGEKKACLKLERTE